jgi:hypothetical protein
MFYTSGYGTLKMIWGIGKGFHGLKSTEECLEKMPEINKVNDIETVFEPKDMNEFSAYQLVYTMGKS